MPITDNIENERERVMSKDFFISVFGRLITSAMKQGF